MIFNTQYSKEEYQAIKEDIQKRLNDPYQFDVLQQKYKDFLNENYIDSSMGLNHAQ